MKKIVSALITLNGFIFANNNILLSDCTKNTIGKCEVLFSCNNNISVLVTYTITTVGINSTCSDFVKKKDIIVDSTKRIINVTK